MAGESNIILPGATKVVATDFVLGSHHQVVKLLVGTAGDAEGFVGGSNPLPVSNASAGGQKEIFSRNLDTNGDGTGTKSATGDYSSAEEIFYIQPGATETFRISRLIVMIEDGSGFRAERYASLGAALTNGIQLRKQNVNGTLIDFTDGLPIKTNAQWGAFCYDAELKTWGAGDELLVVRWTFEKSGQFLRLDGTGGNAERLEVVLNDDFTGVIDHRFLVQGYIE